MFQIGPVLPKPAKPLPEELESFMQASGSHGVIFVSFGSMISDIKLDYIKQMAKAFAKLKQKVLWKIKREYSEYTVFFKHCQIGP